MGNNIFDRRMFITIPLKPLQQGSVFHRTGIACNINGVEFDMLFDTGAEYPFINYYDALKTRLVDRPVLTGPPDCPIIFPDVSITIVGSSSKLRITTNFCEDEDKSLLPPRFFTDQYSITFTRDNLAIFKPKQIGRFAYKKLYKKGTSIEVPRGTPCFDFLVGNSREKVTLLFDTGSYLSVIDKTLASKINISQHRLVNEIPDDYGSKKVYSVPIEIPGVGSINADTIETCEKVNFVSAEQFLDNGIEFTLNEDSASFFTG